MSINSFKKQLIEKLKNKEYRDLFVAEQIFSRLPAKIRLMREKRGWTQKKFGEQASMAQAWVSKIEDPNYGKLTISTLLKVASACDVALVIDFVPFSALLNRTMALSPESFDVESFEGDDFDKEAVTATSTPLLYFASTTLEADVLSSEPGLFPQGSYRRSAQIITRFDASTPTAPVHIKAPQWPSSILAMNTPITTTPVAVR